jgi:hypothetical protein
MHIERIRNVAEYRNKRHLVSVRLLARQLTIFLAEASCRK